MFYRSQFTEMAALFYCECGVCFTGHNSRRWLHYFIASVVCVLQVTVHGDGCIILLRVWCVFYRSQFTEMAALFYCECGVCFTGHNSRRWLHYFIASVVCVLQVTIHGDGCISLLRVLCVFYRSQFTEMAATLGYENIEHLATAVLKGDPVSHVQLLDDMYTRHKTDLRPLVQSLGPAHELEEEASKQKGALLRKAQACIM